jgi:hypothetical protein
MKILIMAPGRCGSSVLGEAVSHKYKLNYVNEPFNRDLHDKMDFNYKNVKDNTLVKCILGEGAIPDEYIGGGTVKFFTEFAKQFDKTFLLVRDDFAERLFSVLHAHQYGSWTGKYERQEIKLDDPRHDAHIDYFMKTNIIIHELWKNNYTILQYLNLYNKDKEVSRKEWSKIVGPELPGYFESIYEKWLSPKNRKKITDVKI